MRQVPKMGVFFCLLLCLTTAAWADLILYYNFDDPDPNYVYDQSSYGNDGLLVADTEAGSPATPLPGSTEPNWITGVYGGALQFCAGTDNYNSVWIAKSDSLTDLGGRWAFSMWIRQDSRVATPGGGAGYPRVISCPNYEIELGVPSWEYDYFWPYVNPEWQVDLGTSFIGGGGSLGQWYHMAVVYDGTNLMKYINGSLVPDSVKNIPNQLIHDEWSTGGWADAALKLACQTWPNKDWFIGALDDVAIWSYAHLDADAIAGLYDGTYTPLTVPVIEEIKKSPETIPSSFLFNTTFINEYFGGIILGAGAEGYLAPHTPWNWNITDNSGVLYAYGIQNVSLWDEGEPNIIKYAAYITPGVDLYQDANPSVGAWQPIREGIRYNLKARVAGYNAIGNVIGVRFYKCSQTDPNDVVLIAEPNDTNTVIMENQKWVDLYAQFVSEAADHNKYFAAKAYTTQGSGGGAGEAWAYFDSIIIEVDGPVSCTGAHNLGLINEADFDGDCQVSLTDFAEMASQWQESSTVEPRASATELLDNSDFYEDIALVPNLGDSTASTPAGWAFVPDPADAAKAGLWNLADTGFMDSPGSGSYQPAGGSVAVYIDTDTALQQIASAPIVNGTKYYLSAMVAGVPASYQNMVRVTWEYVDDPVTPTAGTAVAVRDFVLPNETVWRKLTAEYTADAAAAGQYFRVTCQYVETLGPAENDWALIGYVSIDTVKPAEWPRTNLLANGDFEEVSNLSSADQLILESTYGGWINHGPNSAGDPGNYSPWPPGWTYGDGRGQGYATGTSNGLQCMLWAPPGQPVQGRTQELTTADPTKYVTGGRVSIWLEANLPGGTATIPVSKIYQKVNSPAIQNGATYYLDFTASSVWSEVNDDVSLWPDNDPNFTVELYWVAAGKSDLTGTKGTDWDYITRAIAYADGNLGYAMGGHWQVGRTSFTADSTQAGKYFFVRAFGSFPYATFEEIVLSEEPRPTIGAYTCYELNDKYGGGSAADLDGNCMIGIGDLELFAIEWLDCVDPTGCP